MSEGEPRGWLSIVLKGRRYNGGRVVCWSQHEDRIAGSGVRGVLCENPASSVNIVANLQAGRQRNLRLPNEKKSFSQNVWNESGGPPSPV